MQLHDLNVIDMIWTEADELHVRIIDPIGWKDDPEYIFNLIDKLFLYRIWTANELYRNIIDTDITTVCTEFYSLSEIPAIVIKYLKQHEKVILKNIGRLKILSGEIEMPPPYAKNIMMNVKLDARSNSTGKTLTASDLSFENLIKYRNANTREHIKLAQEIKSAGKNDIRYNPVMYFENLYGPLEPDDEEVLWPDNDDEVDCDGAYEWDGEHEYDGKFTKELYMCLNMAKNYKDEIIRNLKKSQE